MPIRFRCEHCRQRLTVSERKAGAEANCPKCHGRITIPDDEATPEEKPPESTESAESTEDDAPEGDFSFDPQQWVFDDGEPVGKFDPSKVAVSRNVLFLQGVLIAAVGVVSLLLGVMIGQLTAPKAEQVGAKPCTVRGTVQLAKSGRDSFPDIGCVVMALPVEQRPNRNNKISIDSLRPGRSRPERNDASIRAIRTLGGDYALADANGRFQLNLPDRGKYFVLFVSNNAEREATEELDKRDLMQMGNYLLYPNELLGEQKYQWKNHTIRGAEQLNLTFEKL